MHTHDTIASMLATNDEAVKRAITRLAGEGFENGPDAGFLADIAHKLPLYQNRMTPPQYRRARKALRSYVDRLVEIANGSMSEIAHLLEPQAPSAPENVWGIF